MRSELRQQAAEEERREDHRVKWDKNTIVRNLSAPTSRTSNRSQQSGPDLLSTVVELAAVAKMRYPTTFPIVVHGKVDGSPHRNTALIIDKFMDGEMEEIQRLVQDGYDSRTSVNLKSPVANSKDFKKQKTPEHLPSPLISRPVGLPNEKKINVCYMNSLLQVIHPIWI